MKRGIPTLACAAALLAAPAALAQSSATIVSIDRVGNTITVLEPGQTRTRTIDLDGTTSVTRTGSANMLSLDALQPGQQVRFDSSGSSTVGTRAESIQIVTPLGSGAGAMQPGQGALPAGEGAMQPGEGALQPGQGALQPGAVGAPPPGSTQPSGNDTPSQIDREIDSDRVLQPGDRELLQPPGGSNMQSGSGEGLGTGGAANGTGDLGSGSGSSINGSAGTGARSGSGMGAVGAGTGSGSSGGGSRK